ncbi:MAG: nucleotide-binding universal stress UspA family protein [Arenicella sp.]|jgi:nucleotide-binding universal stress UspA family protein
MYKDILVLISEEQGRENLINTAAQFANQYGARLSGMFVSIHHDLWLPPFGLVAVDRVLKYAERDKQLYTDAVEQFNKISEQHGIKSNWISDAQAQPPLQASRYVDLVIASQLQDDVQSGDNSFSLLNSLVLESGKPVMLIPTDWQAGAPGKNIVLGWDEARESARAVGDAMPLLQAAENVHVAAVVPANQEQPSLASISDYLSAREVPNEFHLLSKDKQHSTTAKVIQALGETLQADLYVMGGYGHSKFREVVLGGVTRHMIQHCNAPVLLSH